MADNVNITPGVGDIVAADDVGGAKYQRIKLALGNDGAHEGDVSSTRPMPVAAQALPLPAGAATEATLATVSKETTQAQVKTVLDNIKIGLDTLNGKDFSTEVTLAAVLGAVDDLEALLVTLNAKDFATEATLAAAKLVLDSIKSVLDSLNAKDFATQTTLAAIKAKTDNLDVLLSTVATEATLLGVKSDTAKLDAPLSTLATEATLGQVKTDTAKLDVNLSTRASESTLAGVKTGTDRLDVALSTRASEVTLGTRLAEATYTGRVGEVQASPTAYTVLARLKDIVTQMTTQVRGLFDAAGNAISSALNFGERRLLVSSMNWEARLADDGKMYGFVIQAINSAVGGVDNYLVYINNPVASGKSLILNKGFFSAFTNYVRFVYILNPTVTVSGTAVPIANQKAGGPASAMQVFSGPTVTGGTGVKIREVKAGATDSSMEDHTEFGLVIPPGNALVISGIPDGNNRLASISLRWAEV